MTTATAINIDKNLFPCINYSLDTSSDLTLSQVKVIIKLLKKFEIPTFAILDFFRVLDIEEVEGEAIRILIQEYPPENQILTCNEIRYAFKTKRNCCDEFRCPFTKQESENLQLRSLKYPTSHLNGFSNLKKGTRLKNNSYIPIIKTVWYQMLSSKIAKSEIQLGQIHTDGRIHSLMPIKSGNGKKELIRTIKYIQKQNGKTVEEPTSLHPEQLVGKVALRRKGDKTNPTPINGYMSRDIVLIDEGRELLTSNNPKYSESRKYLRLGMDAYPNNEITKKSVDIEFKDALKYKPHCIVCVCIQPYPFSEEFATDGDLRRYILPYVPMSELPNFEDMEDRVTDDTNSNECLNDFNEFLEYIKVPDCFKMDDDVKEVFIELHAAIVKYGLLYSSKVRNYMDIAKYTLQDIFLKFCAVQALQNNLVSVCKITVEDVKFAFIDLYELLNHQFDFIEELINGNIDYGHNWSGAHGKDQETLNWLYEMGAISEDDSLITISDYEDKIMEVFDVKSRKAYEIKQNHYKRNWISTFIPHVDDAVKEAILAIPAPAASQKYTEIIGELKLK